MACQTELNGRRDGQLEDTGSGSEETTPRLQELYDGRLLEHIHMSERQASMDTVQEERNGEVRIDQTEREGNNGAIGSAESPQGSSNETDDTTKNPQRQNVNANQEGNRGNQEVERETGVLDPEAPPSPQQWRTVEKNEMEWNRTKPLVDFNQEC